MQNLDFDSMTTEKINYVMNLDKDEQELLDSIENDDWVSIPDSKLEIKRFQDIAKRQVSIQKIELQMSLQDSDKIYNLANQLGLSMSNFAEDIIHKYLKGELVEKSN
jgi:predicted DNA binding CopG/RHH family protein